MEILEDHEPGGDEPDGVEIAIKIIIKNSSHNFHTEFPYISIEIFQSAEVCYWNILVTNIIS